MKKMRFSCSYEHLQNALSCSISCALENLFDINEELKSHMVVDDKNKVTGQPAMVPK